MPKRHRSSSNPGGYGLKYSTASFQSADGTKLAGWLAPASGAARGVVILCHGVDSSRESLLRQARMLHRAHFSVFLFDFRARGESEGSRCTLGYRETEDLVAAVEHVRRLPDCSGLPVGVLGQSQGAAVAIMGAARSPEVAAVCAESPYARLDLAVTHHFSRVPWPIGPLLMAPCRKMGEALIGVSCEEVSPLKAVGSIPPRPLLLIEDQKDRVCPPSDTQALLHATGGQAKIWTVPDAGHIAASAVQPAEYERRVIGFFTQALARPTLQSP